MKLYKHKNNIDVAVQVVKSFYVKEKGLYKMKVNWWNIGVCHAPYDMRITERVQIQKHTWLNEWELYEYKEVEP
jgi:hypothetical protein